MFAYKTLIHFSENPTSTVFAIPRHFGLYFQAIEPTPVSEPDPGEKPTQIATKVETKPDPRNEPTDQPSRPQTKPPVNEIQRDHGPLNFTDDPRWLADLFAIDDSDNAPMAPSYLTLDLLDAKHQLENITTRPPDQQDER